MTPKQERFIAEYLIDLNATQAAIRAGYSPRTAQPAASRLLSNVMVSQEIARRQQMRLERADWQAQQVLEELKWQAHSRIGDFFDKQGNLKPLHELTAAQQACISGYEMVMKNATAGDGKVDRVLKIRLWDKISALEMAMQHFKLLSPKVEDEPKVEVSVEVKTLATLLTEQELQLIRERLIEHSRQSAESGTVSKPEKENSRDS